MNILSDRTPRERGLIYTAGALFAAFILWQFVVSPILARKNQALAEHAKAARNLGVVQAGIAQLQRTQPVTTMRTAFDRSVLVRTAQGTGFTLSRMQPMNDGTVRIWIEGGEAPLIYRFMEQVNRTYAVDITRVQVTRVDAGLVDAQMTFRPQNP